MIFKEDYYLILEISFDADNQTIKKAFRRLAKKYHPDMNKDNPIQAEQQFKKINEAYSVLSNSTKKYDYDLWYKTYKVHKTNQTNNQDDFYKDFFKNKTSFNDTKNTYNNDFSKHSQFYTYDEKTTKNSDDLYSTLYTPFRNKLGDLDIKIRVPVSLLQLYNNDKIVLDYDKKVVCDYCKGYGIDINTYPSSLEQCPECKGETYVLNKNESLNGAISITRTTCPSCNGCGYLIKQQYESKKCTYCNASGFHIERVVIETIIRCANIKLEKYGHKNNNQIGDLYLEFVWGPWSLKQCNDDKVKRNQSVVSYTYLKDFFAIFKEDDNFILYQTVYVDPFSLLFGNKISFKTINNTTKTLQLRKNGISGDVYEIKKAGLRNKEGLVRNSLKIIIKTTHYQDYDDDTLNKLKDLLNNTKNPYVMQQENDFNEKIYEAQALEK